MKQEKVLTDKELAILRRGEQQIRKGETVWWRDVKRTKVLSRIVKRTKV